MTDTGWQHYKSIHFADNCASCGKPWGENGCDAEQMRLRAEAAERNLRQLVDDADAFEAEAKRLRAWNETDWGVAIVRAIQKYRTALTSEATDG